MVHTSWNHLSGEMVIVDAADTSRFRAGGHPRAHHRMVSSVEFDFAAEGQRRTGTETAGGALLMQMFLSALNWMTQSPG